MPDRSIWLIRLLLAALLPMVANGAGNGVAVADLVTTTPGVAIQIAVLANDLDFNSPATVGVTTPPAPGAAVISGSPGAPGAVLATYTPVAGFNGTDSFVYSVTDGVSNSAATVTITVLGDADGDGVADARDNCRTLSNATQVDSDNDGYGNRCDGDLNNNGSTNAFDTPLYRAQLGKPSVAPTYNAADINASGAVNAFDTPLYRALLGSPPGPSGLRTGGGTNESYVVGGTVSGLTGSGLVLQNNGGSNLVVSANGPFAFAASLASGASYSVTVLTPSGQPINPSQTCTVSAGSGTVGPGALPNVAVTCTTNSYTVGGTVAGRIAGSGLVLQNKGEALTMLGNGNFNFPTKLTSGAKYNIAVSAQPSNPDQTCGVQNGAGTGTVGAGDIATINVACAINGKWYYSANTILNTISVYSVNLTTGALTPVGSPVATQESGPTALTTDPTGRFAYVTTKGATPTTTAGKLWLYTINSSTGALNLVNSIATGKSPRSITLDGTATFAWVANNVDNTVSSYKINGDGTLTAAGTVATHGTGPDAVIVLTNQDGSGALTNAYAYVTVSGGGIETYGINGGTGALTFVTSSVLINPTTTPSFTAIRTKATLPIPWAHIVDSAANVIKLYTINRLTGALTLVNTYPTGQEPKALVYNRRETVAYVPNAGDSTVSVFAMNPSTGTLSPIGSPVATGPTPVSITLDPGGTLAYVVNSGDNTVSNYSVNPNTGALTPTGVTVAVDTTTVVTTPAAGLATPYVGNSFLFALNPGYGGFGWKDSISVFSINTVTGALSAVPGSPFSISTTQSQRISISVVPSGTLVFVPSVFDEAIAVARINPLTGALTEVPGSPFLFGGANSYGMAFDPRGKFAYRFQCGPCGGATGPDPIHIYRIDPVTAAFTAVGSASTPFQELPEFGAFDPSGTHYYSLPSSRPPGPTIYNVNPDTGGLTSAGSFDRGFAEYQMTIDPSGRFAYMLGTPPPNYTDLTIGVYRINAGTGALSSTGAPNVTVRGLFTVHPNGQFAYTANNQDNNVSAFRVDSATGALTSVPGSPFAAGNNPYTVAVDSTGSFAYVANFANPGTISGFSIDPFTGSLTPLPGSPFPSDYQSAPSQPPRSLIATP